MLTGKKKISDFSTVTRNGLLYVLKLKDLKSVIYSFIYPNSFFFFFPSGHFSSLEGAEDSTSQFVCICAVDFTVML